MNTELSTLNIQHSTLNAQESIFDLAARLEQSYRRLVTILDKLATREYDPAALNAERETLAEIRKHVALAERIITNIIEAHAIEEFKRVILNALAEAAPYVQKRVLRILASRRRPES